MSNRPVTTISARKRGTTRFLTGSTPSTCSASSSSRTLRAPRSAVIAVPATPATHDRGHARADLADGAEHEEAAEAVERAEDRQEVRRLQARARRSRCRRSRRAAGTSTAAARTGTARRTRRRRDRAGAGPTRWSCPSGSSCPRIPRAGACAGRNARSATLRTISAWPLLGSRSVVARNSTRCTARAPPPARAPRRRAAVAGAPAPLVSWPDREGETESPRARSLRRARAGAALAGRSGRLRRRRRAQDARRTASAPSTSKSCARASPPSRRSPRPARLALRGAQHAARTRSRTLAVTVDSLQLHLELSRTGREQAAVWVDRTRARARSPSRRSQTPGSQPARRRPDRLREHLGARPARARPHADVRVAGRAGEGRALHGPLRGRRGPRRQGQGAARRRRRRARAASTVADRAEPADHARGPEHRQGRRRARTRPAPP